MRARLRVLGPIEATIDDQPVDLGGPKQRLVLAILAAAGGHPVSMDRLVDGLWDDDPPARAEASVQAYVSNLRRALEPDRPKGTPSTLLTTTATGYQLASDTLDLDARRFTQLADDAHHQLPHDPAAALTALAEALALWRGPAYGDAGTNPLILPDAARLDELRWRATEDRWTAELALGHHERALPDLRALTEQAPLRERPWILLATALHGAGRQVEALRAVRQGMDTIREQTGLDPGPDLQALEADLLAEPPATDQPDRTPTTTTRTTPTTSLVARQAELDALLDALTSAQEGHGRAVAIAGEPGIGKTHLARALADQARATGVAVAWARCPEASDVPGFWPLHEALTALARALDVDDPATLAADADRAALAPVLQHSADPTTNASAFAVATAFANTLRTAAANRPVLLVVDDAHWADQGTLRVLRHLVTEAEHLPLLLVVTHRDVDPEQQARLASLRDDIARSPGGRALELHGLTADEVSALLDQLDAPADDPADADQLRQRTGGNPFFITELARSGAGADKDNSDTTPAGIRDVLGRRLAALPDTARALTQALAVAGDQADVHLLADVTGTDPAAVLDALDAATTAGLVVADTTPGRYRPAHDLVRETAYDALGAADRARLHQAVAAAIDRRWPGDPAHLPARAWHLWNGLAAGDPAEALGTVIAAAELADRADRDDEAVERWRWAEQLLDLAGTPQTREQVLGSLGHAIARSGDITASRPPLKAAARLARDRGDWAAVTDLLTTVAELSMWSVTTYGEVHDEVVDLLLQARAGLDPDDLARRAAIASRLGIELYYSDDEPRIDTYCDEALDLARRADDPRVLAVVLSQHLASHQRVHRLAELFPIVDELSSLGGSAERVPGEIDAISSAMRGYLHLTHGQLEEAAEALAIADSRSTSSRLRYLTGQLRWYRLTRLLLAGHLDAAEAAYEETSAFYERVGGLEAGETSRIALVGLRLEQGRPLELLDIARPLAEIQDRSATIWTEMVVSLLLDAGRDDEAAAYAAAHARGTMPRDFLWLANTCASAWGRARVGDVDACRVMLDELRPFAGFVVLTGQLPPAYGSADFFLGALEDVCGDPAAAERHLRAAVDMNEALGARAWLARSLHVLAGVLDRGDGPSSEAEALRARARHLAEQVGNPVLRRQVSGS